MNQYSVVVQAGPDEVMKAAAATDLCLASLLAWPSIQELIVALPDIEGAVEAREKLSGWGVRSFIGDPYNVCNRILAAYQQLPSEGFSVRLVGTWKHVDMEYVDTLVEHMRQTPCDFVTAPIDYDITMAADVASLAAIERIGLLPGTSAEEMRAHFNPWGYMEMHPEQFSVFHVEPAPSYDQQRCNLILSQQRCFPENEYFGRDYAGSRYHNLLKYLPPGQRILDIACGSGSGTELMSRTASFALGVDYLEPYIQKARERYPENERLRFMTGDGQTFLYGGKEGQFDIITSFHTLEHVPDDDAMVSALYRNLRPGGKLIVEVPLQMRRPVGVPINPYHLREYRRDEFVAMIQANNFEITNMIGCSRDFYGSLEQARDAIQIHALKPL